MISLMTSNTVSYLIVGYLDGRGGVPTDTMMFKLVFEKEMRLRVK
jgi:hypothetical protein